jgi:hypothetical protein
VGEIAPFFQTVRQHNGVRIIQMVNTFTSQFLLLEGIKKYRKFNNSANDENIIYV